MDFKEAIKQLKEGKSVRRRTWEPFSYIKLATPSSVEKRNKEIRGFYQITIPFIYSSDIVLSEDWQIVGEDLSQLHDFTDALDRVFKQNAKIKLKAWPLNTWVELAEDKQTLHMKAMDHKEYNFMFQCMTASDWELIGE